MILVFPGVVLVAQEPLDSVGGRTKFWVVYFQFPEIFKRLVLARMESYSVETMSGSFLSKFCVENWGDYSLKSSRGPKTSHSIRVLLFFSSSISQPLSTPLGGAYWNKFIN